MSYLERLERGEFSQNNLSKEPSKLSKPPLDPLDSSKVGHLSGKSRAFYEHIFGQDRKSVCCDSISGSYCSFGQALKDEWLADLEEIAH